MKITFGSQIIELTPADSGNSYRASGGEKAVEVEILHTQDGRLDLLINGEHMTAYVSSDGAKRWVTMDGQTVMLTKSAGARGRGRSPGRDQKSELAAPMPGLVRSVNASEGEAISKGHTLMVLEAMKMEIRIQAPYEGKVKKLLVKQGETVEREQVLIEIE